MKNKLKIVLIGIILVLMTSCDFIFNTGYICVMKPEHGSLFVYKSGVDDSYITYTIEATPDEGYCILEENMLVCCDYRYSTITVKKISENTFKFQIEENESDIENIVVSAIFTKITE